MILSNKAKAIVGSAVGLVGIAVTACYSFAADALSAMTSTSTPLDFMTASISDVKTYLYPVLGGLFVLGIVIAIIFMVYRKVRGVAKGKH